jgi:hypothetical protein
MGSTNFLVRELARDPSRTSRYVVHLAAVPLPTGTLVEGMLRGVFKTPADPGRYPRKTEVVK